MARLNTPVRSAPAVTHEGATASKVNPNEQLRRSVLSCLLWEDSFYEDGESVADRITLTADKCSPEFVSALAKQARGEYRLRHAPLWLTLSLIKRGGKLAGQTLTDVIQRPDEITEFLAMYWKNGKSPLSKQAKLGIANAFNKFDEYQLAKYNRDGAIKLRDALFLSHPKPKDDAQKQIFDRLVANDLAIPDTWEVKLSGGGDKREVFTELLTEKKLGYMALLRNLRNMVESGVDNALIRDALMSGAAKSKALPFRYVAAARACPSLESTIDQAMQVATAELPKMEGRTIVLVDHSGSMNDRLSAKSQLNRSDAACALAVYAREICDDCRVFAFHNQVWEVPNRRGMALIDAIQGAGMGGTMLGAAINHVNQIGYDRLIIVTDEQSHDRVGAPIGKGYMLNVASYQNGVGYGQYTHINGWSDSAIRYIQETEK